MPLPQFPSQPDQSAPDQVRASFEQLLERYEMITDIAKRLILSEVQNHESDSPPNEWSQFQSETQEQPELVYDVLSTVIDIAAEAIIELSTSPSTEDEALDPQEQLESLLRSMSDEEDDEEAPDVQERH